MICQLDICPIENDLNLSILISQIKNLIFNMITINEVSFYEKPGSCGCCPFFSNGRTSSPISRPTQRGFCRLWEEMHNSWINLPRRCIKLFNKAFEFPDGTNLVIIINEVDEEGD